MNDLYSILSVSADDIVIDVRYCILYILREGMLDLSEAWVHRPILERFRGYTHQNAIRLHRIAVAHDDCLVLGVSHLLHETLLGVRSVLFLAES